MLTSDVTMGSSDMSHLMIVNCDINIILTTENLDWGRVWSSPGEDNIWIIIIIIIIMAIVTKALVVIDTTQSDEQACDFQNCPMIIFNSIWDKHEQNARYLLWRLRLWEPMNC